LSLCPFKVSEACRLFLQKSTFLLLLKQCSIEQNAFQESPLKFDRFRNAIQSSIGAKETVKSRGKRLAEHCAIARALVEPLPVQGKQSLSPLSPKIYVSLAVKAMFD
jgi:hypothetical protein